MELRIPKGFSNCVVAGGSIKKLHCLLWFWGSEKMGYLEIQILACEFLKVAKGFRVRVPLE